MESLHIATYQVAHLDDASGGTALGTSGGSLLAILHSRLVGVLLDATSGSDDLSRRLAAATSSARATRAAGFALILEDLVKRLTELSRHDEIVRRGQQSWQSLERWRWSRVAFCSCDSCSVIGVDKTESIGKVDDDGENDDRKRHRQIGRRDEGYWLLSLIVQITIASMNGRSGLAGLL